MEKEYWLDMLYCGCVSSINISLKASYIKMNNHKEDLMHLTFLVQTHSRIPTKKVGDKLSTGKLLEEHKII